VQCIGAVVDIKFPRGSMPKVYDALMIDASETDAEEGLTFEVSNSSATASCGLSPWAHRMVCAGA